MKRSPYTKAVAAIDETLLTPDEARDRLAMAMRELDGEELENLRSLIHWFRRRYPTALERLRYLRRKNAEAFKRSQ
jgi:hypothetical protein